MTILANQVLIISQQALFREGLRCLLSDSSDIDRLEVASSISEAKTLTPVMNPDLIIFDCSDLPFAKMQEETLVNLFRLGSVRVASLTLANKEMVIYSRCALHETTVKDLFGLIRNNEG